MDETRGNIEEAPATVPTGADARVRVVAAAVGELGCRDPLFYWENALLGDVVPSKVKGRDWSGAFAIWALHQGDLAPLSLSPLWRWEIDGLGDGFLAQLPTTQEPRPGDVAYFARERRCAIVESVDEAAGVVSLINGNGLGGAVTRSSGPRGLPTAYYSIDPLIEERQP